MHHGALASEPESGGKLIEDKLDVISSSRCSSLRMMTSIAEPSPFASISAICAGGANVADGRGRESETMLPRRGGAEAVMNSDRTGSFTCANRNAASLSNSSCADEVDLPCLATSSRTGTPPSSKMTLPTGALLLQLPLPPPSRRTHRHAQYSNVPFPFPILVSFPLTHTGISGKTLMYTSAPLMSRILRLAAVRAESSWSAVRRADWRRRIPYWPCWSVVPRSEPPVGSCG